MSDVPEEIFKSISVSPSVNCGTTDQNRIACWGRTDNEMIPDASFTYIDISESFACTLSEQGEIDCWGQSIDRQLIAPRNSPYVDISLGNHHGCALKNDGEIECWGNDEFGQVSGAER